MPYPKYGARLGHFPAATTTPVAAEKSLVARPAGTRIGDRFDNEEPRVRQGDYRSWSQGELLEKIRGAATEDERAKPSRDHSVTCAFVEDRDDWVCPVSTDCFPLSYGTSSQSNLFVVRRAEVPERGVSASGVVKTLYILENRHPRHLAARP